MRPLRSPSSCCETRPSPTRIAAVTTKLWIYRFGAQTLLIVAVVLLGVGCYPWRQIFRQTPTFANLQAVSSRIDWLRAGWVEVTEDQLQSVLAGINSGRDAWGNPILTAVRHRDDGQTDFLLVSPGSDGELDVESIDEYFELESVDIVGQFERDIVFRNGKPVTNASDK